MQRPALPAIAGTAGIALLFGSALAWHYPALPGSDDALYLARGVAHFDVLSFAPNFPGYPGLIWLARIVATATPSAFAALFAISLVLTLAAACLAAFVYRRLTDDSEGAIWLALLLLSDPLWSQVALSGLSDGPGLCLLFAAWLAALSRRRFVAGALWGLALCVRPSSGVLALALAGLILRHRRRSAFLLPAGLVGILALGFVWSVDGPAYFTEGWRFFTGHFLIWGNAAGDRGSGVSWLQALAGAGWPGVVWILMLAAALCLSPPLYRRQPRMRPWLILALIALLWAGLAQNPQHLRHLIPVLALAWGILLAAAWQPGWLQVRRLLAATVVTVQFLYAANLAMTRPTTPPMQQAIAYLKRAAPQNSRLVSHHAPDLLRENLPGFAIIDAYYHGDAALAMARHGLRLVSTLPEIAIVNAHVPAHRSAAPRRSPDGTPAQSGRPGSIHARCEAPTTLCGNHALTEPGEHPGLRWRSIRATRLPESASSAIVVCAHFPARLPGDTPLWLVRRQGPCPRTHHR